MQGVLPDPSVKDRISKLCVGLAADCDAPENDVQKLMRDNLPGAGTLPFAGFVTTDLKWVAGFSGYKSAADFVAVLDQVDKSPLLQAKPDAVKKLETLAVQAGKAVEKEDWKGVMSAAKSAGDIKGRSPVRDKIAESVTKARTWAETTLVEAQKTVQTGGDRTVCRVALKKVSVAFAGEPEAKDADAGLKAIDKLGVIEGMAAEQQAAAREKAAKEFASTRWAELFGTAKPADGK